MLVRVVFFSVFHDLILKNNFNGECANCDCVAVFRTNSAPSHLIAPLSVQPMASSSSLLLCLGLCGLLAHVPHAMRQSSSEDVMDDSMVCECKEVKSVKDCPDYNIKKNGFPPGFPHYYHEKAGRLC